MHWQLPWRAQVALLIGLSGCLLLAALHWGVMPIGLYDIFTSLWRPESDNIQHLILLQFRLPHTLVCVAVGVIFALSGLVMQAVLQNPLADPSLMGVASGAALGAVVAIMGVIPWLQLEVTWLSVSIAAFVGAMLISACIDQLGQRAAGDITTLLLASMAINALCGASMTFLQLIAPPQTLKNVTLWLMGHIPTPDPTLLAVLVGCACLYLGYLMRQTQRLNALLLGETVCVTLGLRVKSYQRQLLLIMTCMMALAVSITGIIGFVGLLVPHAARLWVGADHQRLLPITAILGGALMVSADLVARLLIAPAQLPIGIVTAWLGAPCFIALLLQSKYRSPC
ncbi:MAG: iron ABC transporter permease [Shewanellaceae bacterium]|nr:iron ABC transporter permease [Shewanellaceae bacterium]